MVWSVCWATAGVLSRHSWTITGIVVAITQEPLCSCPLASDGYGEDCGNIPVCGLHVRSVFCLALSIGSRNVKFL